MVEEGKEVERLFDVGRKNWKGMINGDSHGYG